MEQKTIVARSEYTLFNSLRLNPTFLDYLSLILLLALSITIIVTVYLFFKKKLHKKLLFFLLTLSLSFGFTAYTYSLHKDEYIAKWKDYYVDPYITNLKEDRTSITTFTRIGDSDVFRISFKVKGKLPKEIHVPATIKVKGDISEPYITYRYLDKKLGPSVLPGYYDVVVHTPAIN